MKTLLKLLLIAVMILPLSGTIAKGQSTNQQIQQLEEQVRQLQMQNQQQIQQLQQQIQTLQNAQQQSDQALSQINQKQVESEDAWYNKFLAEYDKGFVLQSEDEKGFKFKMKFSIMAQIQTIVNDTDDELVSTNFRLRRLELKWDGYAFMPWFYYTFMIDPSSSSMMKDMYFTAAYVKEFAPRIGQWKVPFNREELNSSSALQFVERSIVNDQFSLERDRGFAITGGLGSNNNVAYGIGVFNGDGINGTSVDSNLLYVGRVQLGLGGDDFKFSPNSTFGTGKAYELVPNFAKSPIFVVGIGGSTLPGLNCERKTPNGGSCARIAELGFPQSDFTQITGDISFKMPWFNIEGEYDGRWLAPDTGPQDTAYDQGFRVQAGVFLMPKTVELAARYAFIDYDTNSGVVPPDVSVTSKQWEITPALNYYISNDHRWKIQLNYSFIRNEFTRGESDVDENIVRAQVQANF